MELYKQFVSNLELCVSIYGYDITVKTMIEKLEQTLESCRKISNPIKKNALCNSVYGLIRRLGEGYEETDMMKSIYFIYQGSESGCDTIMYEHIMTVEEVGILREYGFLTYQYRNDDKFPVEEWNDIFVNFEFIQSVQINQQNMKHMRMNRYKMKEVMNCKITNESSLVEHIERIFRENRNQKIYLYGVSNYLTQRVRDMREVNIRMENLTKEEVWMWKRDEEMKVNLALLDERLSELTDERKIDLFVFGRIKMEIKEHIENYMLKELFIEERKIKILEGIVEKETLNFRIIPIRSLQTGDIGQEFIDKYNGLMGIKYF